MKIHAALGSVRASSSQVKMLRARFRIRAEELVALARASGVPLAYANADELRHEMRRRAADFFLLAGEKKLHSGAVDGLLRWLERCRIDENGKLAGEPEVGF